MIRSFIVGVLAVTLVVAVVGCSRSPQVTFYTLGSGLPVEVAKAGPIVVVGPVTLPELVDRPQLVLRIAAHRVDILESHRWGESLKSEISRLIAENLGGLLGSGRVSSYLQQSGADAEYRVVVVIKRFEATPGEAVVIEADWSLRQASGGARITGHSYRHEPFATPVGAEGYDPLVAAYGRALLTISGDIAKAIRVEAAPNKL